jgi:hypothetical protein
MVYLVDLIITNLVTVVLELRGGHFILIELIDILFE